MTGVHWRTLVGVGLMAVATTVGAAPDDDGATGAVYTLSNAADGNAVLVFHRAADGTLTPAGSVATGGLGTGSGLGSQGAVVLSNDRRWLFAVNAGSNDLSVFTLRRGELVLTDRVASGGVLPVSVTYDRGLLYVVNGGGVNNITGFTLSRRGRLTPLPDSARALSAASVAPAQIEFNPEGNVLAVTEKATNNITTYRVDDDGRASAPIVQSSAAETPFGFAFDRRGRLLVSEAAGGAPDASSLSSYRVGDDGLLSVISPAVATTETAACWVVVTRDGRFAYATNAGSDSISAYRLARDGTLTLRDADGRTGETGAGSTPIDMALTHDSRYLYALGAGNGSLSAFRVARDGALAVQAGAGGLPPGTVGLAAY
jgi:6-phosphogluconolactonase (cycloisomerase 2 family)